MGLTYRPSLTPKKLFEKVSPYEIFSYYCNNWNKVNFKVKSHFPSEFRDNDTQGSAQIRVSKFGNLYYIDYGENIPLKPINFVQRKFNLDFPGALKKIFTDFDIDKYLIDDNNSQKFKREPYCPIDVKKHGKITIIKKKKRIWKPDDINWWGEFGWTQSLLKEARIQPIKKYWLNGTEFPIFAEPSYTFEYYENEGVFRRKLYFPERKGKYRFISNIDHTVIQGWHMLDKRKRGKLFITKALKDIGPFKRLGYQSIAPNSESSFIPDHVIVKLKQIFDDIIIYFDNDSTGIKKAKEFSSKYGLRYFYNPLETPKDPSDFVKEFGLNKFNNLIKSYII